MDFRSQGGSDEQYEAARRGWRDAAEVFTDRDRALMTFAEKLTRTPGAMTPEDLGVDVTPRVEVLKVVEPPKREAGVKVADVAELVDKLRNEAKVI